MTTKQGIEQVLTGKRKPMRVPAIIEAAVPLFEPPRQDARPLDCPAQDRAQVLIRAPRCVPSRDAVGVERSAEAPSD